MAVKRITKAMVERPEVPESGHALTWEPEGARSVKGFGIRVAPTGRVSYLVRYWNGERERWKTIGTYPRMKLAEARTDARKLLRRVDAGVDPIAEDREKARQATAAKAATESNTVATLTEQWFEYLPRHVTRRGKRLSPNTVAFYETMMRAHVLSARTRTNHPDEDERDGLTLGERPVTEVTPRDVEVLHELASRKRRGRDARGRKRAQGGDYAGNRAVSVLSVFYGYLAKPTVEAVPHGFNPARTPSRNPEQERGEYADVRLSRDQEARLVRAIYALIEGRIRRRVGKGKTRKHSDPIGGTAILVLLDTGRRKDEILGLEWARLDLDAGIAYLGATKGKASDTCYLSERVREAIGRLPRIVGNPHVFTGHGESGRRHDLRTAWEIVKAEAGLTSISPDLDGFHLHDLRHHRISELLGSGVAPQLVIQQVGHTDFKQLKRYGHVQVGDVAAVLSKLEPVGPAAEPGVVEIAGAAS